MTTDGKRRRAPGRSASDCVLGYAAGALPTLIPGEFLFLDLGSIWFPGPHDTIAEGFECSSATLVAKNGAAYAQPLPLESTSFSLSGCQTIGFDEPCTTSTVSQYTGSLSLSGWWSGGGLGVNLKCAFNGGSSYIDCTYTLPTGSNMYLQSGNPAAIQVEGQYMEEEGTLCGSIAEMSGTFTAVSPKPIHITDVVPAT